MHHFSKTDATGIEVTHVCALTSTLETTTNNPTLEFRCLL